MLLKISTITIFSKPPESDGFCGVWAFLEYGADSTMSKDLRSNQKIGIYQKVGLVWLNMSQGPVFWTKKKKTANHCSQAITGFIQNNQQFQSIVWKNSSDTPSGHDPSQIATVKLGQKKVQLFLSSFLSPSACLCRWNRVRSDWTASCCGRWFSDLARRSCCCRDATLFHPKVTLFFPLVWVEVIWNIWWHIKGVPPPSQKKHSKYSAITLIQNLLSIPRWAL